MSRNKDENTGKENINERVENIKNTVSERAEELAKEARDKAENFAGKTLDAAEKLLNDVFKKNKPEDAQFEEEKIDPKDVEIQELKAEMDDLRDKYVRLYADFDNAKKRMARDKIELIQTAGKEVIKDLLPVIDDFERAIRAQENSEDPAAVKEGVKLIHTKLTNALSAKGLRAMESIGKDFDVNHHEAITEIPASGPDMVGKVVDETEKGYYLNDKLIRFAKVIVAAPNPPKGA